MLYDVGIYIPIYKGICELYLPLGYSDNIKRELEVNGIIETNKGINIQNLFNTMRFTFNISKINPLQLVNNMDI